MSLLLESAIKGSVILTLVLGLLPLLRRSPAAFRHWIVSAGLLCAATAPLVVLTAPAWYLPIAMTSASTAAAPGAPATEADLSVVPDTGHAADAGLPSTPAPPARPGFSIWTSLRWAWIAGGALSAMLLLVGFGRLEWLASRSRRITDGEWFDRTEQIRREFGIGRRITLMQGGHSTLLVTWGLLSPKLILPPAALQWPADRIRVVLYHELAHVRRGDWIVQLAAELLRAVYWFNPVVWIACGRLRHESEQACDDAVLNQGIDGTAYALNLVDIARDLRQPLWMPAAAITRTSNLERRVRAMLDTRVNRRPVSRVACAATLLVLLMIAVPLGGLAATQTPSMTLSGSIVDPMNAVLPGVTVILTNVSDQARHEVQSDRSGRYEFTGLASGEYLLEARLPGFATLKSHETVVGQNVQRNLTLQLGSVQETINVGGTSPAPPAVQVAPRATKPCGSTPTMGDVAIGGNIRVPVKFKHVRPEYPEALRNAGVEGTVVLQGRLGADGFLHDLIAVSAPHAELVKAAIDAAAQWQFDPTLLNCVPVEVPIKITVNFRP
jgi:TonB family protein